MQRIEEERKWPLIINSHKRDEDVTPSMKISSSSSASAAASGAASSNGSDLADERYPNLVKVNKNAHSKKVATDDDKGGAEDEEHLIT